MISWYPFLLFLRQDLQVHVQAHLTALSVSAPKIVLQLQVPFLVHFLSLFWAPIWGHFRVQNGVKNGTRFWTASCSSFGGNLGGILAVLGRSWEVWCSRNAVKTNTKQQFSKSSLYASMTPQDGFWMPSWLILGRFWTPKYTPKINKKLSKKCP